MKERNKEENLKEEFGTKKDIRKKKQKRKIQKEWGGVVEKIGLEL